MRRLSIDYGYYEHEVKEREALRTKMYRDPVGVWTIGWGHNLEANPISVRACQIILEDDMEEAEQQLLAEYPWALNLDPIRQMALLDMMFNMGPRRLRTFNVEPNGSLPRIRRGEYVLAAAQLRQSRWANQTGIRAVRDIYMIETGRLPEG